MSRRPRPAAAPEGVKEAVESEQQGVEAPLRQLWFCPECGKPFANRNSSDSCVRIPLAMHFDERPRARELFDALLNAANETGTEPVRVIVSKTRIELMTRARFAAVSVRRDYLRGHLWLKRLLEDERFRPEFLPPHDWVNHFELHDVADIDAAFRAALAESRVVGDQRHPLQARYRVRSPSDLPPLG